MEAERIEVMQLQIKEHLGLWHAEPRKRQGIILPQSLQREIISDTMVKTCNLSNCEKISFCHPVCGNLL